MKKLRFLGIIVLVAILTFSLTGCPDDDPAGTNNATSSLGAPTNIVATSQSSTSIILSWPTVSGALQYFVYSSESENGNYTQIGVTVPTDTGVCTYTASMLSPSTTYYFRVSSYNAKGESPKSSYVSAKTKIATPVGVTAVAASTSSITVSWTTVSGASGYYIYISDSATGTYNRVGTVSSASSTSYTVTSLSSGTTTKLSPNTTYYFKVSAYNSDGETTQSAIAYAATSLFDAPTGLTVTGKTANSVTLSWSAVSGATTYYIYRSTSATGTYTAVMTSNTTSSTITGLTSGTTYYFKVAVYDSAGTGAQSSSVSATTN